MNTTTHLDTTTHTATVDTNTATTASERSTTTQAVIARLIRREHRARDYGVGYGSSSGYASGRRYANDWGDVRFQCR